MISASFSAAKFNKDMKNLVAYSVGFLDGAQVGKTKLMSNIGNLAIESLKEFIDSNARMNPEMLHHVYEWYKTGSPGARLFDINYTVSSIGLSFKSTFSQSKSIKAGSNVPFYNKARIMEENIPVRISPVKSDVLVFEVDGEKVFTSKEVTVDSPGGDKTTKAFEKTFDLFFSKYFTQAFLRSSGILEYLNSPVLYKKNLRSGMTYGKSVGYQTGYRWIANAGIGGK